MFSWFKKASEPANRRQAEILYSTVKTALSDGDDVHARIVASVAALLVCVAYADMEYAPEEEGVLKATLERVHGLDAAGVDAILVVLRAHTVTIASGEASSYARELLELTDEEFRLDLLDVLVDVAAADERITVAETNMLRSVARHLGLSQQHYNDSQARHRSMLSVLKG